MLAAGISLLFLRFHNKLLINLPVFCIQLHMVTETLAFESSWSKFLLLLILLSESGQFSYVFSSMSGSFKIYVKDERIVVTSVQNLEAIPWVYGSVSEEIKLRVVVASNALQWFLSHASVRSLSWFQFQSCACFLCFAMLASGWKANRNL